ncbi:MAG: Isoprenyl transferase [Parcubacteria group bacterium GW2011_GWC1_38_6]|nr:MAG: Isoprenyl transferase [Parcubacteria group bacterium GW2011_GWC1_38_6]
MITQVKNIPYHLGIIMDGNRRWAKAKGLPTLEGHRRGYDRVKKIGRWCKERGVKVLTLWAFSTENWKRSKAEIDYLMNLLKFALSKNEISQLHKDGIKVRVIGQKKRLSKDLQKLIEETEERTKNNKEGILNLAISYGGRADILQAVQKIINKKIPVDQITEETIDQNLWTADLPNPDLIIRTSGELRTSGFLTWESAYAELYFCQKHWPDFTEEDLDKAIEDFQNRQRRMGK